MPVIFLYFSKDVDSTVCVIKNKQTKLQIYPGVYLHRGGRWRESTVTADAKIKSEPGDSLPFCAIQVQKEVLPRLWQWKKQVGLSRVLSTPCSGKGNICHGTTYSLSNWIMTLVLDEYNVLDGRERN